jgi:photosystem II stability/assembly factor-like uncharacterized protein
MKFIDDSHGWMAGCRGVFYTSNGGQTWEKQSVTICGSSNYTEHTGSIAWIEGEQAIIRTDEGLVVGQASSGNWNKIAIPSPISEKLHVVAFIDKQQGWGAGVSEIYSTINGGKTWILAKNLGFNRMGGLQIISRDEVWAVGRNKTIMHTIDNGTNWEQKSIDSVVSQDAKTADFNFVYFVNQKKGWIGGTSSLIFHTEDGGKTWQKQDSPFSRLTALLGASFVNENEGWIVGYQYANGKSQAVILYTQDGGISWKSQLTGINDELVSVQALANGSAWVVGLDGTVLHTINQGQNWNLVRVN